MGKYKPLVVFGAAVIIALITTFIIYSSIQKRAGGGKAVVIETQPIAVSTVDLNWGTVVVKEMVKMKPYLKSTLPAGAFTDMGSLLGRVVISSIRANDPFLQSRLAPQDVKMGGVAAVIPSKKRAVAVRVDKVIGVAGFIHPGNRVDVLVTISGGETKQPITKIVLENMLVLAVGSEVYTAKGKEEKPAPVDVITLEVTPQEAEKLALAATQGRLQLALRGLTDTARVFTEGTSIPTLLASYAGTGTLAGPKGKAEEEASAKRSVRVRKRVFYVELIQGGKVSRLKFYEGGR
jgi:pilus assembly protein CpaB